MIIDKETGKTKEVDIYERGAKKKADPERVKARFSSTLEQSIVPSSISIYYSSFLIWLVEANPEAPEE